MDEVILAGVVAGEHCSTQFLEFDIDESFDCRMEGDASTSGDGESDEGFWRFESEDDTFERWTLRERSKLVSEKFIWLKKGEATHLDASLYLLAYPHHLFELSITVFAVLEDPSPAITGQTESDGAMARCGH